MVMNALNILSMLRLLVDNNEFINILYLENNDFKMI